MGKHYTCNVITKRLDTNSHLVALAARNGGKRLRQYRKIHFSVVQHLEPQRYFIDFYPLYFRGIYIHTLQQHIGAKIYHRIVRYGDTLPFEVISRQHVSACYKFKRAVALRSQRYTYPACPLQSRSRIIENTTVEFAALQCSITVVCRKELLQLDLYPLFCKIPVTNSHCHRQIF